MQSLVPQRNKEVREDVDFILIGAGIKINLDLNLKTFYELRTSH